MRKTAFNLVEILVAMAILTIGMVGLVGIIPISTEALSNANGKLYASEIAQFVGDYAKADVGYTSPTASPTNLTIYTGNDPSSLFTASDLSAGSASANLAKYKISKTNVNGVLSIQRISDINGANVVDFSAYICIWQDAADKSLLKIDVNWPGVPGKDKPILNRAAGRSLTVQRYLGGL